VKQVGMRAVWLLRGEAPPAPTLEQLSEPTAVVTSFSGLPKRAGWNGDVACARRRRLMQMAPRFPAGRRRVAADG
jgi:hypothetical protein